MIIKSDDRSITVNVRRGGPNERVIQYDLIELGISVTPELMDDCDFLLPTLSKKGLSNEQIDFLIKVHNEQSNFTPELHSVMVNKNLKVTGYVTDTFGSSVAFKAKSVSIAKWRKTKSKQPRIVKVWKRI